MGQFLDAWVEATSVAPATRKRYREVIAHRIKPYLGGCQLAQLDKAAVSEWLTWLKDRDAYPDAPEAPDCHDALNSGQGPEATRKKTKRGKRRQVGPKPKVSERGRELALRVLNKALNDAEHEDVIPTNPVRKVKIGRPRPPATSASFLTPAEVGVVLKAAAADPYYSLYLLALDSGMREGELFALEWNDLNLDTGTVRIKDG